MMTAPGSHVASVKKARTSAASAAKSVPCDTTCQHASEQHQAHTRLTSRCTGSELQCWCRKTEENARHAVYGALNRKWGSFGAHARHAWPTPPRGSRAAAAGQERRSASRPPGSAPHSSARRPPPSQRPCVPINGPLFRTQVLMTTLRFSKQGSLHCCGTHGRALQGCMVAPRASL